MKTCRMWDASCPVPLERLVGVAVPYIDFEGQFRSDGEIVVLDVVADAVRTIFNTMCEMNFPISRMRSVDKYNGDDELSMADNNTSCFNHRPIKGTTITSIHSYGLAIDLNPEQNPFVVFNEEEGTAAVHPKAGWSYLNRHNKKAGMVEEVVHLFAENGFVVWGGRWTTPIDYHHFQTPRGLAELLARTSFADGSLIWEIARNQKEKLATMPHGKELFDSLPQYPDNRDAFMSHLQAVLL